MAAWLRLWVRGLRAAPATSLGVALLVLVTALVTAAVPRVLGRASSDALVSELAGGSSAARNLELRQVGRIAPDGEAPLHAVEQAGNVLRARLAEPIPSVVTGTGTVVDTPLWRTTAGEGLTAVLSLRIQPAVESHIALRTGRLPAAAVPSIADPTPGAPPGSRIRVFETALSTAAAKALAVHQGDQLVLDPEPSDALAAHRSVRLAVVVVGTYDVTDPSDPYWVDDALVARPGIYALSGFVEYVRALALLSPDAYGALIDATAAARLPMTYRWRSYVDPARVRTDQLDPLVTSLRLATSTFPATDLTTSASAQAPVGVGRAMLASGLPGLLQTHRDRWAAAAADSAAVWAGVALTVLACLAVAAEAVARRRLPALRVARFRGASRVQAAAGVLAESLLLVVPSAGIGTGIAIALVPVPDAAPTLIAALVGAGAALAALVLAGLRGSAVASVTDPAGSGSVQQARRVAEVVLITLAVASAILLRGSGDAGTPGTATVAGVSAPPAQASAGLLAADPLLAAAPALLGFAAVIVCARLVPLLLRAVAHLAARRPGLPTLLGLWRSAREGSALAVLAVALATAAVPAFAGLVADRLETGAAIAAWRQVGADFALTGLPSELDAVRAVPIPGVVAMTALGTRSASASVAGTVTVIAVDPLALEVVTSGTPADPRLPAELGADASAGPIAAVLSPDLASVVAGGGAIPGESSPGVSGTPAPSASPASGSALKLQLGGAVLTVTPVGRLDAVPGVPSRGPFIVLSAARLRAIAPGAVPPTSTLLLRAPRLDEPALRAALAAIPGGALATLTSRASVDATLRTGPVVGALLPAIAAAAIVVIPYGALALVLAIALALDARRREAARLAVLGLSGGGAVRASLAEFLPAAALGALGGVALGTALAAFSEPALGLPSLLGVSDLGDPGKGGTGSLLPLGAALVPVAVSALACLLLGRRATPGEERRE